MPKAEIVKLERSRFGADFQLVRAMLSAASAHLIRKVPDQDESIRYLDHAIKQLMDMRIQLAGE